MIESRDVQAHAAAGGIDTGPLSWVIGEIRESYAKAVGALENFGTSGDATQLKHAKNYIHQANGALQIVDLNGVAEFAAALEMLADKFESDPVSLQGMGLSVFRDSAHALTAYLDDLIAGEPHQPLWLFPYYRDVQALVGSDRIHPADLFFPDMEVRVPRAAQARPMSADELAQRRARFERALLALMRGPDPQVAAREMKDVVGEMARADLSAPQRALWTASEGLFDAIATGGLMPDVQIKQLAGRINMQIRRLAEGSTAVAERLLKDVLFYLASATDSGEAVQRVKAVFHLATVIPADLERRRYEEVDPAAARAVKKQVEKVKTGWNKVVSGGTGELSALTSEVRGLVEACEALRSHALATLVDTLAAATSELAQSHAAPSEALALEYATALLFLENTVEHLSGDDGSLRERADAVAGRVRAALKGEALPSDAPWLDEMTRRAQERQTMGTLVTEIQSNLRTVENALDGFFREPTNKADLAQIDKQLQQIAGAFAVLGQEEAGAAIQAGREAVQRFLAEDYAADPADFERLASSFGALGFYAETLASGETPPARFRFDSEAGVFTVDMMRPEQRASLRLTDGEAEADAVQAVEETVEVQMEQRKQEVAQLVEELSGDPFNSSLHGQLKHTLTEIRREAALLDSQETSELATQAISLLDQVQSSEDEVDFSATITDLSIALADVVHPGASKVPEVPVPPALAAPLTEEAVDAELLDIFLSEADEVLGTVRETLAASRETPSNQEHLTTLRRAFHTLKGSSRMVGLNAFGEAGWAVEQVMNLWLSEARSGTPALYALIGQAAQYLGDWVEELRASGRSTARPDPVVAAAERVKAGEPFQWPAEGGAGATTTVSVAEAPSVESPAALADTLTVDEMATLASPMELDVPLALPDDAPDGNTEEIVLTVAPEEPGDTITLSEPLSFEDEESIEHIHLDTSTPDDVKRIGDVTVAVPLYNIFLAEADDMIRILGRDFGEWRHEAHRGVSEAAVRAAHSLAGGSSTVGLQGVHDLAALLETVLNGLVREPLTLSAEDFDTLDMVVDRLRAMLHQFAAEKMPEAEVYAEAALHDLIAVLEERRAAGRSSESLRLVVSAPKAVEPLPEVTEITEEEPAEDREDAHATAILPAMTLDIPVAELLGEETPLVEAAELAPAPVPTPLAAAPAPAPAPLPPAPAPMLHAVPAPIAPLAAQPTPPAEMPAIQQGVFAAEALAVVRDDVDADLLPVFVEEATDQLPHIGDVLRHWQQAPGEASHPQMLMRQLHTVKGSARMAGAMRLGQLLHEMETRVEELAARAPAPAAAIDELIGAHDLAMHLFDDLVHGRTTVLPTPVAATAMAAPEPAIDEAVVERAASQTLEQAITPLPAGVQPAEEARPAEGEARQAQQMVRIRADILERLVNQAGEVSISRSKLDNEVATIKGSLVELTDNLARLRSQLREIEIQAESQLASREAKLKESDLFDPLEFDRFTRFQELTRMMAESVNDVATVQQSLLRSLEAASRDLTVQGRLTRDLQQDLLRVRMVPFASVSQRLYRVVRQAAKELDKRVNLDLRGGQVEVDRSVLERMVGPFEHLLRNSIVHGIEDRKRRLAQGKADTGELTMSVRQDGNEVLIEVTDDGAGLDMARIREKGVALGLLRPDQPVSERQLAELIFQPGFSTAGKVTELAGRGVGMDVVRAEAGALGGRVLVDSRPGKGTRFTISLPLTLASTQVVLVRVGERVHALPAAIVDIVQQYKPAQLQALYQQGYVERQGEQVRLFYLAHMLGDREQTPVAQRYSPVIICRSGNDRIALHVDEIVGNQEVVVKNIGPQLARMIGIAGASVLGSGDIVLILNPVQLAQRAEMPHGTATGVEVAETQAARPAPRAVTELETLPTVMVVDDSLTVRRVTQRLLVREGYQVVLAKDGVDALRQLQDYTPDVMLVDIEMPRMDGFDLTRNVRGDERFRNIPIIMITSRTADKHRNFAMDLGVNVYLGKPYQEEELLSHIAHFVGDKKRAAAPA